MATKPKVQAPPSQSASLVASVRLWTTAKISSRCIALATSKRMLEKRTHRSIVHCSHDVSSCSSRLLVLLVLRKVDGVAVGQLPWLEPLAIGPGLARLLASSRTMTLRACTIGTRYMSSIMSRAAIATLLQSPRVSQSGPLSPLVAEQAHVRSVSPRQSTAAPWQSASREQPSPTLLLRM